MVADKKSGGAKPQMTRVIVNGRERILGATDVARWITRTHGFHCSPQTVVNAIGRDTMPSKQSRATEIMRKHYPEMFDAKQEAVASK